MVLRLAGQLKQRDLKNHDKAWREAESNDSADAYLKYLSVYPDGAMAPDARTRAAPLTRQRLLDKPGDGGLRDQYLDVRTPELAIQDRSHARQQMMISLAALGAVTGAITAGTAAAFAGAGGAVIIGGVIATSEVIGFSLTTAWPRRPHEGQVREKQTFQIGVWTQCLTIVAATASVLTAFAYSGDTGGFFEICLGGLGAGVIGGAAGAIYGHLSKEGSSQGRLWAIAAGGLSAVFDRHPPNLQGAYPDPATSPAIAINSGIECAEYCSGQNGSDAAPAYDAAVAASRFREWKDCLGGDVVHV